MKKLHLFLRYTFTPPIMLKNSTLAVKKWKKMGINKRSFERKPKGRERHRAKKL